MAQVFDDITGLAIKAQESANSDREFAITGLADRQTTLGTLGATHESGTTAVTGAFGAIQALADTVFSVLTASDWTGDSTASMPLPAGAIIYGQFTAFTLTSGRVVAYRR